MRGYSPDHPHTKPRFTHFRDTPPMIVGEGANEIQRHVIAAQLIARGGI